MPTNLESRLEVLDEFRNRAIGSTGSGGNRPPLTADCQEAFGDRRLRQALQDRGRLALGDLAETEVGSWSMPDFKVARAYAASAQASTAIPCSTTGAVCCLGTGEFDGDSRD